MPLFKTANFPIENPSGGSWALWHIQETEEQLLGQLRDDIFSLHELEKIRAEKRRLEWLACRLALQRLLPQLEGVVLQKDANGRPFLNGCGLEISLSHAYPFAAAALHPVQPVGLDVEQPREQLIRIKHKFLSEQEQAVVGDDVRQLCLWWAAKEALYKMNGQPGLIFAKDMLIAAATTPNRLQALLLGKSYELHYQWNEGLLLCVVA